MAWKFELLGGPFGCTTEGPAWDGRYLSFTMIQQSRIMRYEPKKDEFTEWKTGTHATNGTLFGADGLLYGCCAGGRSIVRFETDGRTTVIVDRLEGKRLNTPNDLAIDRQGRIWFTNPWNEALADPGDRSEFADEHVLRADPGPGGKWTVARATSDVTQPNGVLLSADQRTLYVSQCDYGEDKLRELRAYPINPDGSLGRHTVMHQFGKDYRGVHRAVDGMCLDSEGNIVACAGYEKSGPGPLIYVFSPSGRILETHLVPVDHPTNCTFGDADLHSLYITTKNGHLFRVRTDRQGWNLYP